MEEAKRWVPGTRHRETSLYLGATAGMRLLKYGHTRTKKRSTNKHRAWPLVHGHHMSSSCFCNCTCSHPEPFPYPLLLRCSPLLKIDRMSCKYVSVKSIIYDAARLLFMCSRIDLNYGCETDGARSFSSCLSAV